ncbi:MAG TPA: hypothetical protein VJZ00_07315, partial [Thermoanaerobaculia bacterium]|nr:hypothetical protein [Thermoanaerobaculia bacterium]
MAVLLVAVSPAIAATPSEFYLSLLQRGISAYEGGRYPDATNHLKLAAFGFVDSIEQYQTAQVYLTLAYEKLGDAAKARDAARRVITAERIQRKFATLSLPSTVATSFDAAVTKLLGASDAAFLRRPAAQQMATPPAPKPAPAKPQTPTQPQQQAPPVIVEKPATNPAPTTTITEKPVEKPPVEKPAEKPVEKPAQTAPQIASTTKPAPSKPIVPPAPTPTPQPQTSAPAPATPKPLTAQDITTRLAAGERALTTAQLAEARRVYRSVLDAPGVARETLIRVAEGLYRARDFAGALAAFTKIGALRRGEEPYHYYIAVANYETGQYARA